MKSEATVRERVSWPRVGIGRAGSPARGPGAQVSRRAWDDPGSPRAPSVAPRTGRPAAAAVPVARRTYVLGTRPRGAPRRLDNALIALGAVLLLLGLGLVVYPRWAEWQHHLQRPAGPQEVLPGRLGGPASDAAGPA
jgi:hypothetical protein